MSKGQKMKIKNYRVKFGIIFAGIMMFASCNKPFDLEIQDTPIENGYGIISISFTEGESSRTVLPEKIFDKYVYSFTKEGESTGVVKAPDNGSFILELGNYTVAVQAYIGTAEPYTLVASGTSGQFSVTSNSNATIYVPLSSVSTAAKGEFTYNITYPTGTNAEISLQKGPELTNVTLTPSDINQGSGKTQTLQLDIGSYLLTVLVSKDNKYAGLNEVVHIYPSLSTLYTKEFNNDDFLVSEYGISLSETGTYTFTSTVEEGYEAQQTPLTVTVTNTGNRPTGTLAAELSGANANSFTLSGASINSIPFSGNTTFTVSPNAGLAVGTYNATITVSGDNGITAKFYVAVTRTPYIITGSGTSFTATRNGTVIGTANSPIQNVINDIRTNAAGNATFIQFGNGTNILDIGSTAVTFDNSNGTWGAVTLSGKITGTATRNDGFDTGTIIISRNASITSEADIANTAEKGIAVFVGSYSGVVNISGGIVSATTGVAIKNGTNNVTQGGIPISGTVNISGGTVSATYGTAVYNASNNGVVNISGGMVSSANNKGAIQNNSSGAINISGGTVSGKTSIAVYNTSTGKITVSQAAGRTTLITSTSEQGTIYLASGGTISAVQLEITGGTVENTAASNGIVIYNNSTDSINISGGTIPSASYSVFCNSNCTLNISGGTISSTVRNIGSGSINISGGTISRVSSSGPVNISGGTVSATSGTVETVSGSTVTISDGTVSAISGTAVSGSTVNISGGTVSSISGTAISCGKITVSQAAGKTTLITSSNISTGTNGTQGTICLGTGTAEITGGTVENTTESGDFNTGSTLYNSSTGTINILGGTISATSGTAVYNNSTGTVNIIDGTVKVMNYGWAIQNRNVGTINISGGTVSNTSTGNGGVAVYNIRGKITVSQAAGKTTLITSANTAAGSGTIVLIPSTGNTASLEITGGTIENTATGDIANTICSSTYSSGVTSISIIGGKIETKAITGNYAVNNNSGGAVTIGANATILGNKNGVP